MSRPRHSSGGLARSAGGTTAKGLVVILAAVALGIFLLNRGTDGTTAVAAGGPDDTTATSTATSVATTETTVAGGPGTTAAPGASTPSTAAPGATGSTQPPAGATRPPSEVKVQVANAARVPGAAGGSTDQLSVLGYAVGTPTNYTGEETLDRTRIHYRLGFLQEAMNLAVSLDLDPQSDVFDMPAELPVEAAGEDPDLLILLGTDLAQPSG